MVLGMQQFVVKGTNLIQHSQSFDVLILQAVVDDII